ncbi:TylF/MycF/NovP-related O-methyltransferase [Spirosoma endbachense]|uniref:Macrocin O-methyltransferase n=1 Tax=Spirosoma endbachense TaxID=2666025 RepID=A0A6P1VPU3_9BACT|nr:TylF/MycF/NovP-related O-methyltransferase [Spirosoma endbachense]QHV95281.1 hypothetical protein GJR95_09760 [Spirosoma endbachense]
MKEQIENITKKIVNLKKYQHYISLRKKYKNYTMIPQSVFCDNLRLCNANMHLKGDVVECGTWKGGMIAAMAEIMGPNERNYYLFDSFEGLPKAEEIDGIAANEWQRNTLSPNYFDNCKTEMSFAESAMKMAGVLKPHIVKGWFSDTLPENRFTKNIAILRLDGDWYESIYLCMKYLFPCVIENGLIIIDDYYIWDGTSKAIHDYLSEIKTQSKIYTLSGGVAYIIKK